MRHLGTVMLVGSLGLACTAAPVGAQEVVVFNNFGPGGTYANWGTWMGAGLGQVMYSASAFTPSASGRITKIDAGMTFSGTFEPNKVTLYLLPQVGQVPPTAGAIWSQSFKGVLSPGNGISHFTIDDGPTVSAGTRYWLYVETPVTETWAPVYSWWDGFDVLSPVAFYYPVQDGNTANVWQIYNRGNEVGRSMAVWAMVPEPTTALAAGVVAPCLWRRRRAVRPMAGARGRR